MPPKRTSTSISCSSWWNFWETIRWWDSSTQLKKICRDSKSPDSYRTRTTIYISSGSNLQAWSWNGATLCCRRKLWEETRMLLRSYKDTMRWSNGTSYASFPSLRLMPREGLTVSSRPWLTLSRWCSKSASWKVQSLKRKFLWIKVWCLSFLLKDI